MDKAPYSSRLFVSSPDDTLAGKTGDILLIDGMDSRVIDLHLNVINRSSSGFAWGYQGAGPAQSALAILVESVGEELAIRYHMEFKTFVIAQLQGSWSISEEYVRGWIDGRLLYDKLEPAVREEVPSYG